MRCGSTCKMDVHYPLCTRPPQPKDTHPPPLASAGAGVAPNGSAAAALFAEILLKKSEESGEDGAQPKRRVSLDKGDGRKAGFAAGEKPKPPVKYR